MTVTATTSGDSDGNASLEVTSADDASDPTSAQSSGSDSTTQKDTGTAKSSKRTFKRSIVTANGPFNTYHSADGADNIVFGGAGGGKAASRVSIIPSKNMDAQTKADLTEDIPVLARILEKAASAKEEGKMAAMNLQIRMFGAPSSVRNLYVDDYGVIFMLNTRIPLQASATEAGEAKSSGSDSDWEDAKRELTGAPQPAEDLFAQETQPAEEFDAEKVEKLKTSVLDALKNAVHLRHLKPTDRIVVSIASNKDDGVFVLKTQSGGKVQTIDRHGKFNGGGDTKHTMTITVKKESVDNFANGKMTPEEFRKNALIVID